MKLEDIPLVQPRDGYVKWVCFLARLCDGHASCLLEFKIPDGTLCRVSLTSILLSELHKDLRELTLVRAMH